MNAHKVTGLVGAGWTLKVILFVFLGDKRKALTQLLRRYVTLGKLLNLFEYQFLISKTGTSVAPTAQGSREK